MKNVMIMCATLALAFLTTSSAFAAVGLKIPTVPAAPVEDNPGGQAFTPAGELPNVSCAPCTAIASASGLVAPTKGQSFPPGTMRAPVTGALDPKTNKTGESIR